MNVAYAIVACGDCGAWHRVVLGWRGTDYTGHDWRPSDAQLESLACPECGTAGVPPVMIPPDCPRCDTAMTPTGREIAVD